MRAAARHGLRVLLALGPLALLLALLMRPEAGTTATTAASDPVPPAAGEVGQLRTSAPPTPTAAALRGRPPPAAPVSGPVTVTVRGPTGEPLAGLIVRLRLRSDDASLGEAPTDAEGRVAFPAQPFDGSRVVYAAKAQPSEGEVTAVDRPAVDIVLSKGMPLHVDVVDAETGARLDVPIADLEPSMRWDGRHLPGTKASRPVALAPGGEDRVAVHLGAREEGIAYDGTRWDVRVHPRARVLRAVVPLRRQARVLAVLDVDPREQADVAFLAFVGRPPNSWDSWVAPRPARDAYDRVRLRGIPHVPGQPLRIRALVGSAVFLVEDILPYTSGEEIFLRMEAQEPDSPAVRAFESLLAWERWRMRVAPLRLGPFPVIRVAVGPPTFTLRVLDPDGRPAARARAVLMHMNKAIFAPEPAGEDGVVRIHVVRPGAYDVALWGAGAPVTRHVNVPFPAHEPVVVRGARGGTVHLHVVDGKDRPMPFAEVVAPGYDWCDLVGDVQRVDPFVDHRGRRTLHLVEPGEVRIRARLGTLKGATTVQVPEGGSVGARVVLE